MFDCFLFLGFKLAKADATDRCSLEFRLKTLREASLEPEPVSDGKAGAPGRKASRCLFIPIQFRWHPEWKLAVAEGRTVCSRRFPGVIEFLKCFCTYVSWLQAGES